MDSFAKARVLVVDGLSLTRFALASLIDLHPLTAVCAEAGDVPEARRLCAEEKPDLVVLDVSLPRGDGLELVRECHKLHPPSRAVVVSEREDAFSVQRAFRAGAWAYLSKEDAAAEMLAGLESVMGGHRYTSRRVSQHLLEALATGATKETDAVEMLSDRELHVFRLIGIGYGATKVARELGVSVKTVETHQLRIKEKLKLRSCAELQARAKRWVESSFN